MKRRKGGRKGSKVNGRKECEEMNRQSEKDGRRERMKRI